MGIRTHGLERLEIAFTQTDKAQIDSDQVDVRDAVTLDHTAGSFGPRGMPIQTMAHQRQPTLGCALFSR